MIFGTDNTIKTTAGTAKTRIAALLRGPRVEESLASFVKRTPDLQLGRVSQGSVDPAGLRALHGDLLVIEIDFSQPGEMEALKQFLASGAAPPVIVTAGSFDLASMRTLMEIGVLDILPQPLNDIEFAKAIESARARPHRAAPDRPRKGPVVSFIKGGGGAGATSLIVQGACARGRGRQADGRAVLDLDIQFGAAATLIDAEHRASILDLIRDPRRLDAALLQGAMVRPHDRFNLLCAPPEILPVEGLDAAAIEAAIALASTLYSATFVDLPMLWSHWVRQVLEMSDTIVLVLRLTVPSLRRARAQIDMLQSEGLANIPLFIVANAVQTGYFGSATAFLTKAEAALGRKIDFWLPAHDAMATAADRGQPLSEISGGRPLETKLVTMMDTILERAGTFHPIQAIAS
jgi:pilus assembly protein CpaE